jgi:hypothetical protein
MSATRSSYRAQAKWQVFVPGLMCVLVALSVRDGAVWPNLVFAGALLVTLPLTWRAVVLHVEVMEDGLTVRTLQRDMTGTRSPMRIRFDDLVVEKTPGPRLLWTEQEPWTLTRRSDGASTWIPSHFFSGKNRAHLGELLEQYRTTTTD